jgi:hypothetical protein
LNRASQSVPDLLPLGCFFMTSTPSANDHQSPGGDERFSIVKTPDFAARVHWFVIRLSTFFGKR